MQATFADFSATPVIVSNAWIRYRDCRETSSHLAMDAGASTELDFEVDGQEGIVEATLKVTALVSKLGGSPGYAPVDVLLNGEVLIEGLAVPGGGDLPQDNVLAVPGELLRPGTNTLGIRTGADARSMLWLYRVTLDSVYERGRSERALAAEAARDTVFAYSTERRAPFTPSWQPGPPLLFHVDRGEQSLPAQLGWRGQDGAESAVSFQSNMSDFHGHHRAADGTLAEFRGRITGRRPFPEGTEAVYVHRFLTEEGWGGRWHPSGELRLLVEDGSGPVERVTWRDQRGNSGVAALRIGVGRAGAVADAPDLTDPDLTDDGGGTDGMQPRGARFAGVPADDFSGYYQRYNEGPIGYRGTAVVAPDDSLAERERTARPTRS